MTLIKCPDCEHGKVEMEVGRSYGGDFITAMDTCPTCKGAGEVERRNLVEEVKTKTEGVMMFVFITRTDRTRTYCGSWSSLQRLEEVLTDLIETGQYSMVYRGLTEGVTTFYPAKLQF